MKASLKKEKKAYWDSALPKFKKALFNGHFDLVESWFAEHPINKEDEEFVVEFLCNDSYLFSFKSPSFAPEVIDSDGFKRELVCIKYFNANIAIKLLTSVLLDVNINKHHIDLLIEKKDIDAVSHVDMSRLLFKLLNQKSRYTKDVNYSLILPFSNWPFSKTKKSKTPFGDLSLKEMVYEFRYDEGRDGTAFINFDVEFKNLKSLNISLWVDLVSNFSNEKFEFFKKNNIALPSYSDVEEFSNILENKMKSLTYLTSEDISCMLRRKKLFLSCMLNEELENRLPEQKTNNKSKSLKI